GLVNYMTLLGWSPPDSTQEIFTLPDAAKEFTFERVNKAGAKFDWDKLDWINSQYIHAMPVDKLTDLLIPFWKEAGYEFTETKERDWLEKLTALIQPGISRLTEAVDIAKLFSIETVEIDSEAQEQLQKEGVKTALQGVVAALDSEINASAAKDIIKRVVKEQNVKKGLLMRSLRAALTGEMNGPDIVDSWVLLNNTGLDKLRLEQAIKIAN
ncbi:MAG: glutamate--tRNA ligase, partial [Cyanobacteria bacterium J06636_27]